MSFLRKRTWFVEPRGRRWSVRRQDAICADSIHDLRDDAIARGIDLGRRARGVCRVKAKNGRIEAEHVFCDDARSVAAIGSDGRDVWTREVRG